jgi:hypothetical protein
VYLFRRTIEEDESEDQELEPKVHYYAFGQVLRARRRHRGIGQQPVQGMGASGRLMATDGAMIDQNASRTISAGEESVPDPRGRLRSVSGHEVRDSSSRKGFPMVEMGATVKNFSAPMKEVEALVKAGRFHHDWDAPVLAWMMSNVVAHVDKKDNVFPNKQTAKNKIDGAVALIMAMGRAMLSQDESSAYNKPEKELFVL